jgi:hypothetical protein
MVAGGDKISSALWNALDSKISNHSNFTYLVYFSNPTYYAVPYYDGGTTFSGPVLLTVMQNAINSLPAGNWTVYLRDLDEPAGLTIPANVMLVSLYAGSTVGGATTKALLLDQLRLGTWIQTVAGNNSQILEIQTRRTNYGTKICVKPNGTPGGEWTTLLALWNVFNQGVAEEIMEFTWSNNYFLINSFATGTGTARPIVFTSQAGDGVDPLGGKVAEIVHGAGGGAQRFKLWRPVIANNYPLLFYDTTDAETARIYFDATNVLVIENFKETDVVINVNNGGTPRRVYVHAGGDVEISEEGCGLVVTDAFNHNKYRIRTWNGAVVADAWP